RSRSSPSPTCWSARSTRLRSTSRWPGTRCGPGPTSTWCCAAWSRPSPCPDRGDRRGPDHVRGAAERAPEPAIACAPLAEDDLGRRSRSVDMSYEVDFKTVSTVGLESSPVADALAGLRANEARYFKNKYDHTFTVEPAAKAKKTV